MIDTATNTVTGVVPVSKTPSFIAITPDGASAYVTHTNDGFISVIDTATNAVSATIQIGDAGSGGTGST